MRGCWAVVGKVLPSCSAPVGLHKKEWGLKSGKNHQSETCFLTWDLFNTKNMATSKVYLSSCKERELVAKYGNSFLWWESLWGANPILISSYKKLLKDMNEERVGIYITARSPRAYWESNISSRIVILSSGVIYPETEKKLFHFIMSGILDHSFLNVFFVDNTC